MIFRGRCDQLRPSCSQCARSNWTCSGYRDKSDVVFRDETEKVTQKVLISHGRKVRSARRSKSLPHALLSQDIVKSSLDDGKFLSSPLNDVSLHFQTLASNLEDRGVSFFFDRYVFDWNLSDVHRPPRHRGVLYTAIVSMGIAALSHACQCEDMLDWGFRTYTLALRQTQQALVDEEMSKGNTTFRAVTFLAFFEAITYKGSESLLPWNRHFDGAVALANFRGVEQFKRQEGVRLFLELHTFILLNCLRSGVHVPYSMVQLSDSSRPFQSTDEGVFSRLLDIILRVVNLNIAVKEERLHNPDIIISRVLLIEADLEKWAANVPSRWRYKTVTLSGEGYVPYDGYYHIYSHFRLPNIWNCYRVVPIFVNDEILNRVCLNECALPTSVEKLASCCSQCKRSQAVITEMAADLCYSVPFILGDYDTWGQFSLTPRFSSIFPLLWPLYVAGSTRGAPTRLRCWVTKKFEELGRTMGIRQATWALARGVKLNGITIHRFPGRGLGVIAEKDLNVFSSFFASLISSFPSLPVLTVDEAGDPLLEAPISVLRTLQTVPKRISKALRDISVHGLLAAELAMDVSETCALWRAVLPKKIDIEESIPYMWHSSLKVLLPPGALSILKSQKKKISSDWTIVYSAFPDLSYDLYLYNWFLVNTRTFYYTSRKLKTKKQLSHDDCLALIPLADSFNHNDVGCEVTYSLSGYQICADKGIKKGEEVYISYGNHNNDLLLAEYGFILEDNKWDEVSLDEILLPLFSEEQKQNLKELNFLGKYALNEETVCYRTQVALRILCMPLNRWQRLVAVGLEDDDKHQVSVDIILLKALKSYLDSVDEKDRKLTVTYPLQGFIAE
ncbi:hypothetical protein B7463_g3259, partial [Scytalidium lignicola]